MILLHAARLRARARTGLLHASARIGALLCVGMLGVGCNAPEPEDPEVAPVPAIRVGGGPDAETRLLAEVQVALLDHAGINAEVVAFTDRRDVRRAIELGRLDVRPAYSGEAWLEVLGRADPPGDPQASIEAVRDHDRALGLVWLTPRFADGLEEPPANATFAFVVLGPPGAHADLRTVSQLATRLSEQPEAAVCIDREFADRADGLRAVLEVYSIRSDRPFLAADPAEAVVAVAAGDCLAGLTSATDGAAWRAGLRPLLDDLRVFPAFVPAVQVREEVLDVRPEVAEALEPMAAELTTAMLGRWNARVVADEPVEQVAVDAAGELLLRAGRIARSAASD